MNRLLIGGTAIVLALGLAGCSSAPDGGTAADGGVRIALIAKANASDYWTAVKDGAMKAGDDLGVQVTFNGPDTESEGDKQLNQLQSAVADAPAGIGLAPQDGAQDGAPAILDQAKAAGIPVVAFDTPVQYSDVPIATIASDNKGIGAMAAKHMIELTGGTGDIAIVAHGLAGTAIDRQTGFQDYIARNAPGLRIVDVQNGESDPAKSRDKAQGILQANPGLVGLFGTDDDSAIACGAEVQAKGLGAQVTVIGVDASADEIAMVADGQITGAVTQNPFNIGYQTVQVLVEAVKGAAPAQKSIVSESVWYTRDNLSDPAVRQVLGG